MRSAGFPDIARLFFPVKAGIRSRGGKTPGHLTMLLAQGLRKSAEPRSQISLEPFWLGSVKPAGQGSRGVQPAAQDDYECGPTQNHKFT